MKVSDLFIQCLEAEGVRYVFGVPGEETEALLFSLEKSKVRFIPTRHEQGAAFMANMWGRLTGEAGVCLSTLGPGATNLLTGVADAFLDKSPLVAITGQTDLDRLNRESHQCINVVNMFQAVTKWNSAVHDAGSVPEVVRKAFKTAEAEKPGAVHIELSDDMASGETEGKPIPPVEVRRPAPDAEAVREAARLIAAASRPLVVAGNGAIRKRASEELRKLVKRFRLPAVHTFMGQGAVSDYSEESLLTMGLPFRDIVMDAVDEADLVITVGYDIAEYDPGRWNPQGDKKIVHIDFVPAEVYSSYQPAVEIVADVSASLAALEEELAGTGREFDAGWYAAVRRRILDDIESYGLSEGDALTIPGALNILREVMPEDALLLSDVGTHKLWIARNFPVCCPNGVIISNGLASMGIALPGAVAAGLVFPGRPIVAAMGDGAFLMNSQELETAHRLGVAFTVLVFNDNDYGQISWKQMMKHDHATGTRITNPDFRLYAQSFGLQGFRAETAGELRRILQETVGSNRISIVEIPVTQKAMQKLAGVGERNPAARG